MDISFHYAETINQLLISACEKGNLKVIKFLIEEGANVNVERRRALIISVRLGNLKIVKYLVKNGADFHADNEKALITAIKENHLEIVKYLIDQGANFKKYEYLIEKALLKNNLVSIDEFFKSIHLMFN